MQLPGMRFATLSSFLQTRFATMTQRSAILCQQIKWYSLTQVEALAACPQGSKVNVTFWPSGSPLRKTILDRAKNRVWEIMHLEIQPGVCGVQVSATFVWAHPAR